MLFTVAIPTYNRAFLLEKILETTFSQLDKISYEFEILISDDFSQDNTIDILQKFKQIYPEKLRYIINEKNLGISKNRNILLQNSRGKFIFFNDSDVIPGKDCFISHLKLLLKNENIISQGKLIFIPDIDIIKDSNILSDSSNSFFDTANLAIKKENILNAGGFDENFSGYGWEDLELGIRLKKSGFKTFKNKKALSYHYSPYPNLNEITSYLEKEKQRALGALYFYKKHPSLEVKMITQFSNLHFLIDKIISNLLGLDKNNILEKLKKLSEKKDYNKFIFLFRTYLNHIHISELKNNIKHSL